MTARQLVVEIDSETEMALARSADARHVPIEQVAAEVIVSYVTGEDRPLDHLPWTAEDLAAIEEGLDQIDSGEFVTQEEVEARIEAILRR